MIPRDSFITDIYWPHVDWTSDDAAGQEVEYR